MPYMFCLNCGHCGETEQRPVPNVPHDERPEFDDICSECKSDNLTEDIQEVVDWHREVIRKRYEEYLSEKQRANQLQEKLNKETDFHKMYEKMYTTLSHADRPKQPITSFKFCPDCKEPTYTGNGRFCNKCRLNFFS